MLRSQAHLFPSLPGLAVLRSVVPKRKVIVVGGGAAGFFAAIACAEASPDVEVTILEKTDRFLGKVRISGGGRCNVTNGRLDTSVLGDNYPRGARALHHPYQIFKVEETVRRGSLRAG